MNIKNNERQKFNLEQFKKDNGIKNYVVGRSYEIYKSYFPDLCYETFCILDKNGMLGRLWRGQRIDLPSENIHIEECSWRFQLFDYSKIYAPVIMKVIVEGRGL
jgi:hypothetical protein